ncbi:MAG: divalent-cation tolerance protein CutA [Sterolibacterium sp.]|jgi:periplasmic divalent cation tolerance protein|nr:divalent-cation tolerance protein CutA [Sterolibacterium sp.]
MKMPASSTPHADPHALLVLTNLPDAPAAHALATQLVEARLAACVNILAPCHSIYRWQAQIETASEVPLLIKTTTTRYAELEAAIRHAHPYELPEIIAVPITDGLDAYLGWIAETTTPAATSASTPATPSC